MALISAPMMDTPYIDHTSPVPVFMQIEQDLRRQILSGALATGTHLPRETELAERYGASRETLRRALKGLADAGFIQRTHGVGTIVTPPPLPVTCDLDLLVSFSEQLALQGHVPETTIDIQRRAIPPAPIAQALELGAKKRCVLLRRIISVSGRPVVLNTSWLPALRFPRLEKLTLVQGSLWKTLGKHFDVTAYRSDNKIELVTASNEEARLLYIDAADSLLRLTGIVFDQEHHPVEHSTLLSAGNARFHFAWSPRDKAPRR
jgi:GntR family transcriptional regulator